MKKVFPIFCATIVLIYSMVFHEPNPKGYAPKSCCCDSMEKLCCESSTQEPENQDCNGDCQNSSCQNNAFAPSYIVPKNSFVTKIKFSINPPKIILFEDNLYHSKAYFLIWNPPKA